MPCHPSDGELVPAALMPHAVLWPLIRNAASVALWTDDPVSILGQVGGITQYCRGECDRSHEGSLVLIPDVTLLELQANGHVVPVTQKINGRDGRAAYLFAVGDVQPA
jgi:hypothetical protein